MSTDEIKNQRSPLGPVLVDVIIPVYRGLLETRTCIGSVLASKNITAYELVVIDDASSDPEIVAYLDDMAGAGRITLLRNVSNLGFVLTANRGMAMHPERDVVLLNSDTTVANDWLDRLQAHVAAAENVGTVTPLSNNATICSYPFEGWPGGVPGGLGLAELDRLCAMVNPGCTVELPTAVGFCMVIRRACLNQVGMFDAERFGRGYGEENDFCLRASHLGWRHCLAPDVFVFHQGGVSFSEERYALQQAAMQALLAAHPDYLERIARFQSANPVAPLRAAIDSARIACSEAEKQQVLAEQFGRADPTVSMRSTRLHILHGWGGGTARWVADFCHADHQCRNLVLRSNSDRNHTARSIELLEVGAGETVILRWELADPIDGTAIDHAQYLAILTAICEGFGVGAVMVSSLIGHALCALTTSLPTTLVLHDLYPFCPALFGYYGETCSTCGDDRLSRCLVENPHNLFWHNGSVGRWQALRTAYADRLAASAVQVVAPSESILNRWVTLMPEARALTWTKIEHGIDRALFQPAWRKPVEAANLLGSRRLRIVVPGRLLPHKGLSLIREAVARLADDADFLLLGCGEFGMAFSGLGHVEMINRYSHAELPALLASFHPDMALFASVLPESFSYTLSEMFAFGLPVVATRLGAFVERIEDGKTGFLVEPDADALVSLLQRLARNSPLLMAARAMVLEKPVRDLAAMLADYRQAMPLATGRLRTPADQLLGGVITHHQHLARELAHSKSERSHLIERVAMLTDEQESLRSQLAERTVERDALLKSNSWAATAPLRWATNCVRKLRHKRRKQRVGSPADDRPTGLASVAMPADACSHPSHNFSPATLRVALDLPDAARLIIVHWSGRQAVQPLAELLSEAIGLRNDLFFLIADQTQAEFLGGYAASVLGLHVAMRRLFVGREWGTFYELIRCMDIALLHADDEDSQAFSREALRAGVPVKVFGKESAADTPFAVAATLSGWLDLEPAARVSLVDATLQRMQPGQSA